MALSISEVDRLKIVELIRRLRQGSAGRFLDSTSIEQLNRIFGNSCGFRCGCPPSFILGMQEEPYATLLTLLICPDAPAPGTPGFVPPAPPVPEPEPEEGGLNFPGLDGLAIFGHETITNTGFTELAGDLDLSPGTAITGFFGTTENDGPGILISGAVHQTDTVAADVLIAATAAYNFLEAMASTETVAGDLGGLTKTAGVYTSTSTLDVTGVLTLDGSATDVFVFQVASALNIANGASILLTGGAIPANVYWQVGSSATLGTTSVFNGTIIALASVTAQTGASVEGKLIALTGAVTLDTNVVNTAP